MIAVLMREQNSVQITRRSSELVHPHDELLRREAGIDEDARGPGLNEDGISRASTSQHRHPQHAAVIASWQAAFNAQSSCVQLFPPNETVLKICGITRLEDGEMLAELGVHALGANFFPPSKRYLAPEVAPEILLPLAGKILRVGVFVNESLERILALHREGLIDVAQLHGDEPPEDAAALKGEGLAVIKALPADRLDEADSYDVEALLIDTPAGSDYGGTGKVFDWSVAREFLVDRSGTPVLLAGGITPENAARAVSTVNPAGLDLASGAESAPGIKDRDKVLALLAALNEGRKK